MEDNKNLQDKEFEVIDDFINRLLVACESPCDIYRIYVNIVSSYEQFARKYYKPFLDKLYAMSIQEAKQEGKSQKKITADDYYQMLVDFEVKKI